MPSNKTVKILIDIDAKGVKSLTKAGKSFEVMGKKADKTSKSLKTFGKVSAKLSQGLKTMAVGLVAASAGLVIATKSALKSADSIAKTADKNRANNRFITGIKGGGFINGCITRQA